MKPPLEKAIILHDYKTACISRQLSILGRKEVHAGKAKFGIFGDGKEIAQLALAKVYREGDWRSGYYRDQTLMLATGLMSPTDFFAQLYGNTDPEKNSHTVGRSFNNHFATVSLHPDGSWRNLMAQRNTSSDISPTGGQMPRLLGLAYASKIFRQFNDSVRYANFSDRGNEVAFGTIGDASTSEGHFWETLNAAAVLQVPMAVCIWDDGFGISVPRHLQTVKSSISEALKGFEADDKPGIRIYKVPGWDYPALCKIFEEGVGLCREYHIPVVFHVTEMTQPLGHSTSGSHERYKSAERLDWEEEFDPILKFGDWIVHSGMADRKQLNQLAAEAEAEVSQARATAWEEYLEPIRRHRDQLLALLNDKQCQCNHQHIDKVSAIANNLRSIENPIRKDITSAARKVLRHVCADCPQRRPLEANLGEFLMTDYADNIVRYSDCLYNETPHSAMNVPGIAPTFGNPPEMVPGREVLRHNFDALLSKHPEMVIFGEDVGKIGGVNQTLEGLQAKYGEHRVTDTGIREATIVGQGIGMALRGLRPVAEIQYFDYLLYALQTMSDDLATTQWRTRGGQMAPLIISTRGHRLEGIWHSGSPLSMVINSIRGIYVCVPRNMTQAAGFYNTLMAGADPALVIEPLNGYRLREMLPTNVGEYQVPLGIPEILQEGTDVTLVTYGSCVRIAQDAIVQLAEFGVSVELIDIQTLLPFDIHHIICRSIQKTGRVLFFDEDVPGGATAFMLQKVIEEQAAFQYLRMAPQTLSAREHRPAYGTDGDYYSNPNAEDVFNRVYNMMQKVS